MDLDALFARHDLILFDGVCPLCNGFVAFVARRDRAGRYRFVSVQSALGQAILTRLDLPLIDWESNVLLEAGQPHFKSAAQLRILRQLPAPWSWLWWLRHLPGPLLDWLYDRIARNRYAVFGRSDRCALPPAGLSERFLA